MTSRELTPEQEAELRNKLCIVMGNAELIAEDERVPLLFQHRAVRISKTVQEIRTVLGWDRQDAALDAAIKETTARAGLNPDAHLGAVENG